MSSETSIDGSPAEVGHYGGPAKAGQNSQDALQPWQLFTLAGLVGATIVVFLARGQSPSGIVLLSCTIFAAALVGLAALRTFLPLTGVTPDDGPEMLGGRTRAALEREKNLVLRTIKELEFDHRMRKLSDKDFEEMSARLRARAGRLMRQLDAGSVYRGQIERELEKRLQKSAARDSLAGSASRVPAGSASRDPAYTAEAPEGVRVARSGHAVCAGCQTQNDPDARFCKNCGARLEAAP